MILFTLLVLEKPITNYDHYKNPYYYIVKRLRRSYTHREKQTISFSVEVDIITQRFING